MAHYICKGGCKGVSQTPGVCQATDCPSYQKPLEHCDCADQKHHRAFEQKTDLSSESEPTS